MVWFTKTQFKINFQIFCDPPMVKSLIWTLTFLAQVYMSHLEFLLCLLPFLSALYFSVVQQLVQDISTPWFYCHSCTLSWCLVPWAHIGDVFSHQCLLRVQSQTSSCGAQLSTAGSNNKYWLICGFAVRILSIPQNQRSRITILMQIPKLESKGLLTNFFSVFLCLLLSNKSGLANYGSKLNLTSFCK